MAVHIHDISSMSCKSQAKLNFFSLPLEIRQMIYELLFENPDDGMIGVGNRYGEQYHQLETRKEVSKADPRLRNEFQDWTGARHKSCKKTKFFLYTNWEHAPTLQEELAELKAASRRDTFSIVEILIPYWDTHEIVLSDEDDYRHKCQAEGGRQLIDLRNNLKAVVEVLNRCDSIQMLQVRYDSG